LKRGLLNTDLIDWKRFKHFIAIPERLTPVMTEIAEAKGFRNKEYFCYQNWMQFEEAANFQLPK